ncbi:MAG: hypothetical protein WDM81_19910 [Rhizomicrobium sp.]
MRWEIPPMSRFSSLNRMARAPSRLTIRTDHLSPIRESTPETARQSPVSWM